MPDNERSQAQARRRMIDTTFSEGTRHTKFAQSCIIALRRSNRSPRRYAASTLSPMAWARAISATSRE